MASLVRCCEPTSLELIVREALKSRNIQFLEQVPTRSGFVLDFLVGEHLVIEVDGPCHDSSKSRKRDRFRDRILRNEGYKVYRMNYSTINNTQNFNSTLDFILSA